MAGTTRPDERCIYELKVENEKLRLRIMRLEKDVEERNRILRKTQSELEMLHEDCDHYLNLLQEINRRQADANQEALVEGPMTENKDVDSLENELAEIKTRLEGYIADLEKAEMKVKSLTEKEKAYKEKLGIEKEESSEAIGYKIDKLKSTNMKLYVEKKKLLDRLRQIEREKQDTEADIHAIGREKDRLRFLMRQQEMTIKRMQRDIRVRPISKGRPPSTPRKKKPEPQPHLLRAGLRDLRKERHVCVICKKSFVPAHCGTPCRFHHGLMEGNRWSCCRETSDRSPGCLEINHLYIQFDDDKRAHLTDGDRNMMMYKN